MNPIEFQQTVPRLREIPPARPTCLVTWEDTDDDQEFVLRLRTDCEVLTRRVRLNSHAEAGA